MGEIGHLSGSYPFSNRHPWAMPTAIQFHTFGVNELFELQHLLFKLEEAVDSQYFILKNSILKCAVSAILSAGSNGEAEAN